MRTRRGTDFWPGELGKMVHQYEPGDIVVSNLVESSVFTGIVKEVHPKLNKVLVAWGGGSVVQHDPDEIMLHPYALKQDMKLASRRNKVAISLETDDFQTEFLSDEMQEMLNDQVAYEMYSAYLYYMVAAWSMSKGLAGFSSWFERQGDDEIQHAMKIYKYLVDTGSDVTLPAIPSPGEEVGDMETMEDATRAVLDHEMSVTKRWQRIGELAKSEPNLATQELAQWFMTEQVEEEDGAVTLHQKVQLADSGAGLLLIDSDLKNTDPNEA
jgi:ferritin